MSLRSGPSAERTGRVPRSQRLQGFFRSMSRWRSQPAGTHRLIPASRDERTIYPPQQQVELRFRDGSAKIFDPRSPEASALQKLADQLRQTGS